MFLKCKPKDVFVMVYKCIEEELSSSWTNKLFYEKLKKDLFWCLLIYIYIFCYFLPERTVCFTFLL